MKNIVLSILFLLPLAFIAQKKFKVMMEDHSINFYEVCNEAENYFKSHKKGKGSGWKGYQRWKNENESKYFPAGRRDNIDPFLVSKSYERIKQRQTSNKSLYTNGWVDLGPHSVDSITGHYAAGLGRVEDFAVNPLDQYQLYMASRSGGFWKSNDGGENWQGAIIDFLPACGVNTIATSPTNFDSVLINVRQGGNGNSHGIYRSIDGGSSFQVTPFNPINLGKGGLGNNWKINQIAYHPTISDLIFITADDGLYRSNDNLITWTKIINGSISEIEFHPANPSIIYIYDYYNWGGNKNRVLISNDTGLTFTNGNLVTGNNNKTNVRLAVSPQCDTCLWWASSSGIWKSVNNGLDFTLINATSNGPQGLIVDDLDPLKMLSGYVDAWRSEDGANTLEQCTWWSLGSGNHNVGGGNQNTYRNSTKYVHADLRVAKSINGIWYIGTDGFLCKSSDKGLNWEVISNDNGIREFYAMGSSQSNHYRTIAGSQDNGTSIKLKDTWIEFNGGDGMEGLIHPLNEDWMFGSFQYGTRFRTKDAGQTNVGGHSGYAGYWVAPLFFNPNNHMEIFSFTDSIHKSVNFGNEWSYVGRPSFTGVVQQADIAQNNSDIFAVSRGSNIEKTNDGGINFIDISSNLPNYSITDIAFNPLNDDNIFVTFNRHQDDGKKIFSTQDGGLSWSNITYNLNDMPLITVVVDHLGNIYVGGEIGVYTMPINGTNWELYNQNLPNVTIKELEVVKATNTIRAATWGRGLWEFSLKNRVDFPAITTTRINDLPTDNTPKQGSEQYVSSTINYDGVLSSVFVKWSIDSLSFDSIIPMNNTLDSTWVSNTYLPKADTGTNVYFKVFAVGDNNDTTETYKFMYTVQPFEYCDAEPNGGQEHIRRVQLANINNGLTGQDGYTYYEDSIIYLVKDSSYVLTINTFTGFSSNDLGAWIDYDKNAIFTEDENLGYNTGGNTGVFNFLVPQSSQLNDTLRLRIRHSYWGNQSQACGTTLGEVEDYPVVVIESPDLAYSFVDSTLCDGQALEYFNNEDLDSVLWVFTNGINTYTVENQQGVLTGLEDGVYDLEITGYKSGYQFQQAYLGVFSVGTTNHITINNTSCDVSEVGTVTEILTNSFGCDSIISTITTLGEINASIMVNDFTLTAAPASLSYQWINCNSNTPISGETAQEFSVLQDGEYSVEVNDMGCVDTALCVQVSGLSIVESTFDTQINVFPNPVQDELTLSFGQVGLTGTYNIIDSKGKLINSAVTFSSKVVIINMDDYSSGVYYLEVQSKDKKALIKVIKK